MHTGYGKDGQDLKKQTQNINPIHPIGNKQNLCTKYNA